MEKFVSWLKKKMQIRNIGNNELARRAGFSNSYVSDILTEKKEPTYNFCEGIAKALDQPLELVLRKARLLPPKSGPEEDPIVVEGAEILRWLSTPVQEFAISILRRIKAFDSEYGPFEVAEYLEDEALEEKVFSFSHLPDEVKKQFRYTVSEDRRMRRLNINPLDDLPPQPDNSEKK